MGGSMPREEVLRRQREYRQNAGMPPRVETRSSNPLEASGFANFDISNILRPQGPSIGADPDEARLMSRGLSGAGLNRAMENARQNRLRYGSSSPSFSQIAQTQNYANDVRMGMPIGTTSGLQTGIEIAGTFAAAPALAGTRLMSRANQARDLVSRVPGSRQADQILSLINPTLTRLAATPGGKVAAETGNKAAGTLLYSSGQKDLGQGIKPFRDAKLLPSYARLGAYFAD